MAPGLVVAAAVLVGAVAVLAPGSCAEHVGAKPHLVFVLVDDLGYNGVGYQNPSLKTPTIDALARSGMKLGGYYTYKVCAPARASFLTGRFPYKLAATKTNFAYFWTLEGTDLGYTMFPAKLKQAGYATHMIGKWHQGFYCPEYLPTSRGFDTYFGFLSGCEDHVDQHNCCGPCNVTKYGIGPVIDLYGSNEPAWGFNGTNNGFTFTEHATMLIAQHSSKQMTSTPFFLYMALHNTHAPFEVPPSYADLYNFSLPLQQTWSGMVSMVDDSIKNVTEALRDTNMWDTTLLVVAGDNGSPTAGWGAAGSNAPLRGSKASNWEGGVHPFGFVAGGFLPAKQRGTTLPGMIHICDFYKTFVTLAGGDPVDRGGPAAQDSIDQSGYILGTVSKPPRTTIVHDHFLVGGSGSGQWHAQCSRPSDIGYDYADPNISVAHNVTSYGACCDLCAAQVASRRTGDPNCSVSVWNKVAKVCALKSSATLPTPHTACQSLTPMTLPPPGPPPFVAKATGAIRVGDYKLLVGPANFATWFGDFSPNATFNGTAAGVLGCVKYPCLFNIAEDPTEHDDIAAENPDRVQELLAEFYKYNADFHPGGPKGSDQDGYCRAAAAAKGFMTPWRSGPAVFNATDQEVLNENVGDPILQMLLEAPDRNTAYERISRFALGSGGP